MSTEALVAEAVVNTVAPVVDNSAAFKALGAALAVSVTGIASAWSEKEIGCAAIGAMTENENLFGKGLILTVIPETIVIFGLVVALLISS
jgi:V/A-type H+-transporting ATPase subunit K